MGRRKCTPFRDVASMNPLEKGQRNVRGWGWEGEGNLGNERLGWEGQDIRIPGTTRRTEAESRGPAHMLL